MCALARYPWLVGRPAPSGGPTPEPLVSGVPFTGGPGIFTPTPIPPLDGSNVVYGLLPPRQQYSWRQYQQYGPILLLLLLLAGGGILRALVGVPGASLADALIGLRLFRGSVARGRPSASPPPAR